MGHQVRKITDHLPVCDAQGPGELDPRAGTNGASVRRIHTVLGKGTANYGQVAGPRDGDPAPGACAVVPEGAATGAPESTQKRDGRRRSQLGR